MNLYRKEQGFTLVEVLLAVVIFSILMTGLYTALSTAASIWRDSETYTAYYQRGRVAAAILSTELRGTYEPSLSDRRLNPSAPSSAPLAAGKTQDLRVKVSYISKKDVIRFVACIKPVLEKLKARKELGVFSFFEVYTALALKYFLEEKVDFLVLECGLGGRLDATNIITPLVSVIT